MYAKIPPAKKNITAARANSAGGDKAIFGSMSLRFGSGIGQRIHVKGGNDEHI
jgi:hypothetical protein